MKFYQQGDCLIKETKRIPLGAQKKMGASEKQDFVLVEGEHTGHAHRIAEGNNARLFVYRNSTYLKVYEETHIEHEEHKTIILPPGNYEVDRVREYDHFDETKNKELERDASKIRYIRD